MISSSLHIIHLPHRTDRMQLLLDELRLQQIHTRQIWAGISDNDLPARGILRAHQQIVNFAKEQGLPFITIAEDDIAFTAKGAWRFYHTNCPDDFDLYLGGITWGAIDADSIVQDFSGTALYTISERFYDFFLHLEPGKDFDRQLAGKGRFVVCNPMAVVQHSGFSDNSRQVIDMDAASAGYDLFKG